MHAGRLNESWRKDREIARGLMLQALSIDPADATAHARMGLLVASLDLIVAAMAWHVQRALELDPRNLAALLAASNLLALLERHDEALRVREYALTLDPADAGANIGVAISHERLGRWNEALAMLRTVQALRPGYANLHGRTAVYLARKGMQAQPCSRRSGNPTSAFACAS
ncbi:MAG: tetratricopeptide repeat protein [Burkholderiales bacterium]|nr:tetratricopeptide repeat protein [Burkholderiales bacterium]